MAREIATPSAPKMKKSTAQPLTQKRLTGNCSRYLTGIGGQDAPTALEIITAFGKAKSNSVQELVASAQAMTNVDADVIETAALHFSGTQFHPVAVLPSTSPPARILSQGRPNDIRRKWTRSADGLHTPTHTHTPSFEGFQCPSSTHREEEEEDTHNFFDCTIMDTSVAGL